MVSNAHFSNLHRSVQCPHLVHNMLDINCIYQMFAHRSFVILFTNITIFPYSEQVQDSELYNTSVGDDFVAKNN